jgi:ubiquinone/menaquinone biosynthesis C-methylase UbiE
VVWQKCLEPLTAGLKGRRCLDVGAGTGFLSFILHEMGLDVVGLDLSIGMLSRARDAARQRKLSLCQADAECLPITSSSFDLVISRHLLWTLPDPQKAVAEWMRVLRPGGRIVAIDGNWFDPAAKKRVLRWVSCQLDSLSGKKNPISFREYYHPIEANLPLYQSSRPDICQALFEAAGLKEISHSCMDDVNCFYRRNASHSYRLANADAVFLVAGEKEC